MAKLHWWPDFCPGQDANSSCQIELDFNGDFVGFIKLCPYHQGLKNGGLTPRELHAAILESSRAKEDAREEARKHMNLEHAPPYVVDPDGSIAVITGHPEGPERQAIRGKAEAALARRPQVKGASKVRIE